MARPIGVRRSRRRFAPVVIPLLAGVLAGCGDAAPPSSSQSTAPARSTSEQRAADSDATRGAPTSGALEIPPELQAEAEALGQPDAAWYAVEHGISVAEAVARLNTQVADRGKRGLVEKELGDLFGGLWIEHEPEFRVVIASTSPDIPAEAMRIAAELDAPVAWRTVAHSFAELRSLQDDLGKAIWQEGVRAGSSVDVKRNAVVLEVLDPAPLQPILSRFDYDVGMVIVETVTGFPTLEGEE